MPEIWLNYGAAEVVVDIRAENLERRIDTEAAVMGDDRLAEVLEAGVDLSRPVELVVLQSTPATRRVVSALYAACERRSLPPPRVLAERGMMAQVRRGMPEGAAAVSEFGDANLAGSDMVFLAEAELDGLFGFETVSTRLLRRFGQEGMLAAYAKRRGNLPAPGQPADGLVEARRFVDNFEVTAIEVVASSRGVADVAVGHPAKTMDVAGRIEPVAVKDAGEQRPRAVMVSTGKEAGNRTLSAALSSLWNCHGGVRAGGLAVLLGECGDGLGSEALRQFVEGRMGADRLRNPARYVDGMEDLLYLAEVQKAFQVGVVSVLPEFYSKKLGMIPLNGAKHALDYVLRTQGPRQKVTVVSDGARTLLR